MSYPTRRSTVVYYGTSSGPREIGKGGVPRRMVVAEFKDTSFNAVKRWLDEQGTYGHVNVWRASTQRRDAVATRHEDGTWEVLTMHGWKPMDEEAPADSDV